MRPEVVYRQEAFARVAQWIERLSSKQKVGGSSPSAGVFDMVFSVDMLLSTAIIDLVREVFFFGQRMEQYKRIERVEGEAQPAPPRANVVAVAAQQAFFVIVSIGGVLLLWQIIAQIENIPPFFLPKPTDIAVRFWSALGDGTLTRHLVLTWSEALVAFSIAFLFSSALGYILAKSPLLEKVVSPFIIASQSTPVFALAPFVLILIGSGFWSNALLGALVAFFPMLVNTIAALRNIGAEPREVMRSYAATERQVFFLLELPSSLPYIFGGIRIGITLSVIGVLVAELIWADRGIGFLLNFARGQFDTPLLFAGILALIIMNMTMFILVAILERVLMPWRHASP